MGTVAGYFLLTEHLAHVVGALPFLPQWPTLPTLLMFPILLLMHGRLAVTEEEQMRAQFGDAFERYAQSTPRFIPRYVCAGL